MKYFTQSNLYPNGNCWQTALACILEVDPETLPPQTEIERTLRAKIGRWGMYSNCLQGYLRKHHGLSYVTISPYEFTAVRPVRAEHVMCGPTVRTAATGTHHAVVAVNGYAVWDPHPSRDGLIATRDWGCLGVYIPPQSKEDAEREARCGDDEEYQLVFGCLCPLHNLEKVRALPDKQPAA